jgi:putative transcriptional regulator
VTSSLDMASQAGHPGCCDKQTLHEAGRRAAAMRNDVRERRTAKGLAQAELARELAVSRQTINSIETGRYTPSLPLAMAIARFFGSSVEEIFHADHD